MAALFLVTTAVVAFNTLYFKRMLNCYRSSSQPHDYAVFVSVFDILLWAVFMSAAGKIGGVVRYGLPKRGLLRAACADQLGTLLASVGATHVPGQTQVLLNQSVLPLTMLLSLVLGRRYGLQHFLGAALVLAGAATAVHHQPVAQVSQNDLSWRSLVMFCMAQVAVAAATLIKEVLLSRTSSDDVAESMAVGIAIAWRRVPMGVFLALLMPRHFGEGLGRDLWDGLLCFCGMQPREGDTGCPWAPPTTLISVMLYAIQTFLCLRLTQQKGATIRSIAAVTAVPLAQLLFSREGDVAEALSCRSVIGLLLCLSGFATYSLADARREKL